MSVSADFIGRNFVKMERYSGISAEQFFGLLEPRESVLVLDCRPFMAYNTGHIVTASNVHCPPILKRRSGGFVSLENIIPCETKRQQLLNGYFTYVIMYDKDTKELSKSSSPDSNLFSVMKSFHQQVQKDNVFYLKGGYKTFSEAYPHLCVNQAVSVGGQSWGDGDPYNSMAANSRIRKTEDKPVEILPHLYLGDYSHAGNKEILDRLGITALLNVSNKCKNYFSQDFLYKNIPVDDNSIADLASWFDEAIDFIELVRQNEGRVLLHCKAGISRSATICLAYLMFTKAYSLEEAYQYVHGRRSVISPNLNFMRQLHDFEKELLASKSTVLASTLSATSSGVTKTFTWPLPSVTISQGQTTDYLQYNYDFSPISSPTLLVSTLLTPS